MSLKNMLISQTEGYFENLYYRFLEEPMLLVLNLKWNLKEKIFSCIKTKINSNFAIAVAERSNHQFSFYLMDHLFQTPDVTMECMFYN